MARTYVGSAVVVRQKYYWPDVQLNLWTIVMLVTAGLVLGVNAQFMSIQSQFRYPSPWCVYAYPLFLRSIALLFVNRDVGSCRTV